MTFNNQTRREVMLLAWDLHRTYPDRGFADCVRGAWKFTKKLGAKPIPKWAGRRGARRVAFSSSLIITPIGRASARRADWHAARTTSRLGD
jgi:hypothetical protein